MTPEIHKRLYRLSTYLVLFSLGLFSFIIIPSGCKKDKLITDASAKLSFNTDSVLFDTVFTTIGSATRNFRVYNNSNQRIKIADIRMESGTNSPFILNVDGIKGKTFSDIEIAAKDSIYIFVQVNVNPTNNNSPVIISDNIVFTTNGNQQKVNLEAWGQDAYYHYPNKAIKFKDGGFLAYSLLSTQTNTTITWTNDKPHVIYGWLVVDSTQHLVMNAGTRVFMHKNAGLWVYRYGSININGVKGSEVIFQGTRREEEYKDIPGQWDRIWINEGSTNNRINYAIIKNAFIGLQPEYTGSFDQNGDPNPSLRPNHLTLTNTKIQNCSLNGIYSVAYHITAGNTLVSNCQEECLKIVLGGTYSFRHCTFSNYWSKKGTREKPCVTVSNNADVPTYGNLVFKLDSLYFGSSIIYGKLGDELALNLSTAKPAKLPQYDFVNCVLKTGGNLNSAPHYTNNINTDPGFINPDVYNFELPSTFSFMFSNTESNADAQKFLNDLNGKIRNSPHNPGVYVKN